MAGYECSLCSGAEQAVLLITPLTGGETMAVGPDCMGVALIGMTAGHFEVDAEKLLTAVERLVKRAEADAAKGAAEDQAATVADGGQAPGPPDSSGAIPAGGDPSVGGPAGVPPGGPDSPGERPEAPAGSGRVAELAARRPRHASGGE